MTLNIKKDVTPVPLIMQKWYVFKSTVYAYKNGTMILFAQHSSAIRHRHNY